MKTAVLLLLIVGLLINVYLGVCFVVVDNARERDSIIEASGWQAFLNIANFILIFAPFIDIENAALPCPFQLYVLFWILAEIVLIIRAKFV